MLIEIAPFIRSARSRWRLHKTSDTCSDDRSRIFRRPTKQSLNLRSLAWLTLVMLPLLGSCKKSESSHLVDESELPGVLKTFENSSQDRSQSHHSTTIMMENFSFLVGTQEAQEREGKKWDYVFEGPSRPTGYFVVPRMKWVETMAEVEEIIRADRQTGKGIPTSALND